jgi:hypothetical protein
MKAVYGLYSDPDAAQRAVGGLRAAGLKDRAITIISSQPFEEYDFSQKDRATWMPRAAALGGVVGLAAGYLLTSGTQRAWPIETGGMPIVPMWPNLIIMFELTMLAAVITTAISFLVSSRIPRAERVLYDPEIADDQILVGIANPPEASQAMLRQVLAANGAGRVKTIP